MLNIITSNSQVPQTLQAEFTQAKSYIKARHSDATRKAYAFDVLAFNEWATIHRVNSLPATPETVVLYLTSIADSHKPATLRRKLAAIRHFHRESNLPTPTDSELVTGAMSGIKRVKGSSQKQAAPATIEIVQSMMLTCENDLRGKRDRLLLALGFGGAFRRSELAQLTVNDIEITEQGLRVTIRKSKTDQEGQGVTVPVLNGARIQVNKLFQEWLEAAGITSGAIFRGIGRGDRLLEEAITDRSIANIIKARATLANLDADLYSGHSLRSGFLTSAASSGASLFKMMDISRHKKVDTLRGYIRNAEQFKDHAGSSFM